MAAVASPRKATPVQVSKVKVKVLRPRRPKHNWWHPQVIHSG